MALQAWRWPVLIAVVLLSAGCGSTHSPKASSDGGSGSTTVPHQVILITTDGVVVELDDGSVWSVGQDDEGIVTALWDMSNEAVRIGKDGHTLIDMIGSPPNNVRATQIGTVSDRNAYAHPGDKALAGIGHSLYFTDLAGVGAADGSIVTLDDGSIWEVNDFKSQQTASQWAIGDNVAVHKGGGGTYRLVDTDIGTSVSSASYLGQEVR